MSKLTDFECKIPTRISVSFGSFTEKYTIKSDENGDYKVFKNRLVMKDCRTAQDIVNLISSSFGIKPLPKPDLKQKDTVRVGYGEDLEYETYRDHLLVEPILDYHGEWQVPVLIPGEGFQYVNCKDVKLIRRRKE